MKKRLDVLLVERGLAPSRERARRRILAGEARVNGQTAAKAGFPTPVDAQIELVGRGLPYVSRGGLKLEAALDAFSADPTGKTILDAGASTGGFTDCLLQRGAAYVYALDVGYGQLAWKLRNDPRVCPMERVNVRYAKRGMFDRPLQMATVDLAFIGLTAVLHAFAELLPVGADLVALVKPQFEAGRREVEKGGVVRRRETHLSALERAAARGADCALEPVAAVHSPIKGPAGNIEFFIHFIRRERPAESRLPFILTVEEAHCALNAREADSGQ